MFFGECRNLFFGLSLFLRKGHPFANDFSARLVVFHVRGSLGYQSVTVGRVRASPTVVPPFARSLGPLVLRGLGEVSGDRLFAQFLARFEAMQPMYKDEAITIAPNQDGCLLSDFQYTLRDLLDGLWLERCAALYRHVDVGPPLILRAGAELPKSLRFLTSGRQRGIVRNRLRGHAWFVAESFPPGISPRPARRNAAGNYRSPKDGSATQQIRQKSWRSKKRPEMPIARSR